jgi:hypothetical protein
MWSAISTDAVPTTCQFVNYGGRFANYVVNLPTRVAIHNHQADCDAKDREETNNKRDDACQFPPGSRTAVNRPALESPPGRARALLQTIPTSLPR